MIIFQLQLNLAFHSPFTFHHLQFPSNHGYTIRAIWQILSFTNFVYIPSPQCNSCMQNLCYCYSQDFFPLFSLFSFPEILILLFNINIFFGSLYQIQSGATILSKPVITASTGAYFEEIKHFHLYQKTIPLMYMTSLEYTYNVQNITKNLKKKTNLQIASRYLYS